MILQRFDTAQSAAEALAGQVVAALRLGQSRRGGASLVLPGGHTPVPLFHLLREAQLDWNRISVTLTDERWVPDHAPASNAALVRNELLVGRAAAARFVPLYDGSASASDATASVWRCLQSVARPFDVVTLGMGEDGHFASLFPGNDALAVALDPLATPGCVAMRAPVEPTERISLNLAALLQTRRLFLLVTGARKLRLVTDAAGSDAGGRWPVSALLAQHAPAPEVYWAP
jgi:6-phosphogluconolactonase